MYADNYTQIHTYTLHVCMHTLATKMTSNNIIVPVHFRYFPFVAIYPFVVYDHIYGVRIVKWCDVVFMIMMAKHWYKVRQQHNN